MKRVIPTSLMVGVFFFSTMNQALGGDGVDQLMFEVADSGQGGARSLQVSVPEPSTLALLGLGLIWVGARRVINRKK